MAVSEPPFVVPAADSERAWLPRELLKRSPDVTRAPSPLRRNRSVDGFSAGQRCDCVTAAYLGTGASATACAPGRRPNVGRVWSKHCERMGLVRRRVRQMKSPNFFKTRRRRGVRFVSPTRRGWVSDSGTHRAGLHGGLARGHALDLDITIPAVRGAGGGRSGAGRRWGRGVGGRASAGPRRLGPGIARTEAIRVEKARTCPRRGHRPRRST